MATARAFDSSFHEAVCGGRFSSRAATRLDLRISNNNPQIRATQDLLDPSRSNGRLRQRCNLAHFLPPTSRFQTPSGALAFSNRLTGKRPFRPVCRLQCTTDGMMRPNFRYTNRAFAVLGPHEPLGLLSDECRKEHPSLSVSTSISARSFLSMPRSVCWLSRIRNLSETI